MWTPFCTVVNNVHRLQGQSQKNMHHAGMDYSISKYEHQILFNLYSCSIDVQYNKFLIHVRLSLPPNFVSGQPKQKYYNYTRDTPIRLILEPSYMADLNFLRPYNYFLITMSQKKKNRVNISQNTCCNGVCLIIFLLENMDYIRILKRG